MGSVLLNCLKRYGASSTAFFACLLMASVCHASAIQLPKTWQTKCYNTFGREITCGGTGQDGDTQAGVAWPVPRFVDNSNGTVKDRLTGLVWMRTVRTPTVDICKGGAMLWTEAFSYIECLNYISYGGITDWRMPNVNEMRSISKQIPEGDIFIAVNPLNNYWTSTTWARDPDYALAPKDVLLKVYYKKVLPVSGGSDGVIALPKTNQTRSFAPRDDGELQIGVAWPSPRFTDNADGTATDNLTGLIWTKDAATPTPAACGSLKFRTWQAALNLVKCLNANNYLGKSTWRLPNIVELESLLDFSQFRPCLPQGHPFSGVKPLEYWSSSTDVHLDAGEETASKYYALAVNMMTCNFQDADKDNEFPVWPVSSQ
jgi:hypothetical protein